MKKLLFAFCMLGCSAFGQTATNFNCNDCAAANHDLFTELNAGKVVVICWVMPCSTCIGGALSAQSACQSFSASNPGQVYYYCVDDVANTSCSTLLSWCNTNGITNTTAMFSNATINMTDYGTAGMPKVVVLGDQNHTVYYNQNNPNITTLGIQTAIGNALSAIAIGVKENENVSFASLNVFPNPANTSSKLSFSLANDSKCFIAVNNQLGQKVAEVFNGTLHKGENSIDINTSHLSNGNYFINFSNGNSSKNLKLIIAR
ncbi:MAG: T9SS type A sorting domain-containing protein [Sphingobacteriaceae bacterium]|nr:T9SS type A sorting domain-containing protein [Sphingobacteriaceae bacterium]